MNQQIKLEVNDHNGNIQFIYYPSFVHLKWIAASKAVLVVGRSRIIPFDFETKAFNPSSFGCGIWDLSSISIYNNTFTDGCLSVTGTQRDWFQKGLKNLGRYYGVVFTDDLILLVYNKNKPDGRVLAKIRRKGIYTPEATSYGDEDHRFTSILFEPVDKIKPKIWKVC